MVIITIDTEKDSMENIEKTINFLRNVVENQNYRTIKDSIEITATHSEPDFNNSLPSTEPLKKSTSANDLLNMFDGEDKELKPKKDLADFSQFMKW